MPLSNVNGEGFENKIAILANAIGARLSYFWRPYFERGLTRQTFDTNDCDLLMDMPADYSTFLTTIPIYRTTYAFAYRGDSRIEIKGVDDPGLKQLRIGVIERSAGPSPSSTQRRTRFCTRLIFRSPECGVNSLTRSEIRTAKAGNSPLSPWDRRTESPSSIRRPLRFSGTLSSASARGLYVANGLTNDITVIDLATFKPVVSAPVGRLPWGIVKPRSFAEISHSSETC
jgi:YVTN family beta-propeller protein